ncbi:MAG: [FeFe] hydrogenase H-cluster radical SAM maturase HydE [Bacteroidales bacterium]
MDRFSSIDFDRLTQADLVYLLGLKGEEQKKLIEKANEVKLKSVGNIVYLRGLIEYSNVCAKNCYYCGIRRDNTADSKYVLTHDEVLSCAEYAYNKGFGSLAIQSGEISNPNFVNTVESFLKEIKLKTNDGLGVTLSMGEQSEEVFKRWLDAGAHRYLLRIETSNRELYKKLHPNDNLHNFDNRVNTLKLLQKVGYNTGSGVMIGLPFQTLEDLANDLLFLKEIDVDMVGMGPYVEHAKTPLYKYKNELLPIHERFELSINMVACLRLLMPNINIAATTAMQAIVKNGREQAIIAGANVIMPNITPLKYRENYLLYKDKPGTKEQIEDSIESLTKSIEGVGHSIGFNERGDSLHFKIRNKISD